jgi:hypothetical protein
VKSYPLPCDERSKYSVPRNVTVADWTSGVAAAEPVGPCVVAAAVSAAAVAAKASKMDRRFIISSLQ